MLPIYLCEDESKLLHTYKKYICNYLLFHDLDMQFILATQNPYDIIQNIQNHRKKGIYFLDIELHSTLNGLELGKKIREYDPDGYIIFITTHAELSLMVLNYRITATDFILKDEPEVLERKIQECLELIYKRSHIIHDDDDEVLSIKEGNSYNMIRFKNIIFIETISGKHRLKIHTTNSIHITYGILSKIVRSLDDRFYRCHKSYIINRDYIESINTKDRTVLMKDGSICLISIRAQRGLIKA